MEFGAVMASVLGGNLIRGGFQVLLTSVLIGFDFLQKKANFHVQMLQPWCGGHCECGCVAQR
jgi:hypothetical protein